MLKREVSPAVLFATNRNPPQEETAALPMGRSRPRMASLVTAVNSPFVRFTTKAETFEDPG